MPRLRLVAAALGAATLGFALAAAGGPLAPSKPSQLVTARAVSEICPIEGYPANTAYQITSMSTADGTQVPFVIPPKQVLVVTSVSLVVSGAPANETAQLVLLGVSGTDGAVLAEGYARTDAGGLATFEQTLPTGIAVRSGVSLCVTGTVGSTLGAVTGFFAKDK